jgi:hypothetical protein
MTIPDVIHDRFCECFSEAVQEIVSALSQASDNKYDRNVSGIKDLTDNIISMCSNSSSSLFKELAKQEPGILQGVTVNYAKLDRAERWAKAVKEREDKEAELLKKLKSLRKQVPESVRDQLKQ